MNAPRIRKFVVLNFIQEGAVSESETTFQGFRIQVTEHRIGYRYDTAEALIAHYDGYADGICLSGIRKELAAGKTFMAHPGYLRLMRKALRTSLYVSDDLGEVFTEWTLKRLLQEHPRAFAGKTVLFHTAVTSQCLNPIAEAGAKVLAMDAQVILGVPKLLMGVRTIELFLKSIRPLHRAIIHLKGLRPLAHLEAPSGDAFLRESLAKADIFVTYGRMLEVIRDLSPLTGKDIITDFVDPETRARLNASGVRSVLELIPNHPDLGHVELKHFSVIAGIIDQMRLEEGSPETFADYLLNWFDRAQFRPNLAAPGESTRRRCAFIIHPLAQSQLWQAPGLEILRDSPAWLRQTIESAAARTPAFLAGTVTGVRSHLTGQEVDCDLFALPATPRELLRMDPESTYRRLVAAIEQAERRGAVMAGLGAYTKVIGDAGVSVARRSPIPVTNGNSYSASTTLWAAREMVEKMGLIPSVRDGKRLRAKAMIIGATGSIGRVSALLVATVFHELVLVATRPDKLLELKEEVQRAAPGVRVIVTTRANSEIHDCDLIVTATSNQGGALLDIHRVKPGAVICDCSRPLDIDAEMAAQRPDVLVIESGEVLLPGAPRVSLDLGLPQPSVYACLAETMLLTMEGRFESFSLSKQLSMEKVKEIYRMGLKHGATLSAIRGPFGVVTDEVIAATRERALSRLKTWRPREETSVNGLRKSLATEASEEVSSSSV